MEINELDKKELAFLERIREECGETDPIKELVTLNDEIGIFTDKMFNKIMGKKDKH